MLFRVSCTFSGRSSFSSYLLGGQRSKYTITSKVCCFVYRHFVYRHFVYCHFVYCHSVSSTVGSISAEPGTCFSLSIALQCTCSLALFLGSPLTLTKNRLPAHTQNFKMVYCFKEKQIEWAKCW